MTLLLPVHPSKSSHVYWFTIFNDLNNQPNALFTISKQVMLQVILEDHKLGQVD